MESTRPIDKFFGGLVAVILLTLGTLSQCHSDIRPTPQAPTGTKSPQPTTAAPQEPPMVYAIRACDFWRSLRTRADLATMTNGEIVAGLDPARQAATDSQYAPLWMAVHTFEGAVFDGNDTTAATAAKEIDERCQVMPH